MKVSDFNIPAGITERITERLEVGEISLRLANQYFDKHESGNKIPHIKVKSFVFKVVR